MTLKNQPPDAPAVTLQILATPDGVLITAVGDMGANNSAASVARTLCCFADGLIEGAQLVRLGAEIQEFL